MARSGTRLSVVEFASGAIFLVIAIVLALAAWTNAELRALYVMAVFFALPVVFIARHALEAHRALGRLWKHGQVLPTLVQQVALSAGEDGPEPPYHLFTQHIDSRARRVRTFESDPLYYDPTPWLRDPVLVAVNPADPDHYDMDLSFLPGRWSITVLRYRWTASRPTWRGMASMLLTGAAVILAIIVANILIAIVAVPVVSGLAQVVGGMQRLTWGFAVLATAAIAFAVIRQVRKERRQARQRTSMRLVRLELSPARIELEPDRGGRRAFHIHCEHTDPESGTVREFVSQPIWFDPTEFVQGRTITVHADPDDPAGYLFDLRFLPQADRQGG
jgi:hypothetical protein